MFVKNVQPSNHKYYNILLISNSVQVNSRAKDVSFSSNRNRQQDTSLRSTAIIT